MNGVKVGLGKFLGPVFFRTALPCSGFYHLERGGMPLHDAVWINCKKGATVGCQLYGQQRGDVD